MHKPPKQDITKFFLFLSFMQVVSSSLMPLTFIHSVSCFYYNYRKIVYKSKKQNKTKLDTTQMSSHRMIKL